MTLRVHCDFSDCLLGKQYVKELVEPLRQKHRCVRDRWEVETMRIEIEVTGSPTAHQQREAALNLRDWAQKNDAPAELLTLLNS